MREIILRMAKYRKHDSQEKTDSCFLRYLVPQKLCALFVYDPL